VTRRPNHEMHGTDEKRVRAWERPLAIMLHTKVYSFRTSQRAQSVSTIQTTQPVHAVYGNKWRPFRQAYEPHRYTLWQNAKCYTRPYPVFPLSFKRSEYILNRQRPRVVKRIQKAQIYRQVAHCVEDLMNLRVHETLSNH
jgi:hypothetical protein